MCNLTHRRTSLSWGCDPCWTSPTSITSSLRHTNLYGSSYPSSLVANVPCNVHITGELRRVEVKGSTKLRYEGFVTQEREPEIKFSSNSTIWYLSCTFSFSEFSPASKALPWFYRQLRTTVPLLSGIVQQSLGRQNVSFVTMRPSDSQLVALSSVF